MQKELPSGALTEGGDVAQSSIEPRESSLGLELSARCGLERMEEEKQGWVME